MIQTNLKKLTSFIEELYKREPIDILYEEITRINNNFEKKKGVKNHSRIEFNKSVNILIDEFKDQGMSDELIVFELYQIIKKAIYRYIIYKKALEFEVDPRLYKKEMGFLFKGKPLK